MKKFLAFALTVVMVMSVSTAAFANITPNCGGSSGGGGGGTPPSHDKDSQSCE